MDKTITKIPNGTYQCYVRAVRVAYEPVIKIELSFDILEGEYKNYYSENWIPMFDNELALTIGFSPLSYVEGDLFIHIIRAFEDSNPAFRFLSFESLLNKNICVAVNDDKRKILPVINGGE
jgi:hypothetical protein